MMRIVFSILLGLAAWFNTALASDLGVSLGIGHGTGKLQAYRLGVQGYCGKGLVTQNQHRVNGYWELAYTQMHKHKTLHAESASLVLRFTPLFKWPFYIDLGLGIAEFSRAYFVGRELGQHFLFEERVGAGLFLGSKDQFELGYRLTHFSNGYLAKYNHGLNLHLVIIGFWFR